MDHALDGGVDAEPKKLTGTRVSQDALEQNARLLEGVLDDFGVKGEIVNVRPGPSRRALRTRAGAGDQVVAVIGLADDIARSMSAVSARVAVVQGRNAIGVELRISAGRRSTCASFSPARTSRIRSTGSPSRLARRSAANR